MVNIYLLCSIFIPTCMPYHSKFKNIKMIKRDKVCKGSNSFNLKQRPAIDSSRQL